MQGVSTLVGIRVLCGRFETLGSISDRRNLTFQMFLILLNSYVDEVKSVFQYYF